MKHLLTLALLSIGILSCTSDKYENTLNGSWTVVSFQNLTTQTTEMKTQENSWNKEIRVTFTDTWNSKNISGINITNQIYGEFSFKAKNQIIVSNLMSTEVNQPRWADEFILALLDQNLTFKIINNRLTLYYKNKTKSVTLKRG
jgi:hypothetical protein